MVRGGDGELVPAVAGGVSPNRMETEPPVTGNEPLRMEGEPGSRISNVAEWITNLRQPARRHYLNNINQRTVAKNLNTVIEPGVDVVNDLEIIRSGQVVLENDRFVLPNGRIYGHHNGTLYPVSGAGFHQLDRPAFKALGVYNQLGDTPRSAQILDNMGISAEARNIALQVWRLR